MSRHPHPEISEAERFPVLSPAGRRLLHAMRQDPQAPIWNWPNGEQLDGAGLMRVQEFAAGLESQPPRTPEQRPDWLDEFVEFCLEEVPFYRRRSARGTRFELIPSCAREDLAPQPWEFVPDSQPLGQLIVFRSTGTTGHPAVLPTHPATAACGIPLLELALSGLSVRFPRGAESVALTNVVAYPGAYTTAIVVAFLQEAGCVRVNLCAEDWPKPEDCPAYLDRWHAPVMLGDPIAFAALEDAGIQRPPEVMISSIMALSKGLASELTDRYGCHILDLYALTETGILAAGTPAGHVVLPHDVHVEILDEEDQPCGAGVRGEIAVTGGRNPFAPLLRYRTGDFAASAWRDGRLLLTGLEGRRPVLFPVAGGRVVHSMEVSHQLRRFPLAQFQLHQTADGEFQFRFRGRVDRDELRAALAHVLGQPSALALRELPPPTSVRRKLYEYSTEMQTPLLDRLRP